MIPVFLVEAIQRDDKFMTPSAIEILSREPLDGGDHGLLGERLLGECGGGGNSEFVMESLFFGVEGDRNRHWKRMKKLWRAV